MIPRTFKVNITKKYLQGGKIKTGNPKGTADPIPTIKP